MTIIPLNKIKPTEFLMPQDVWDEIANHYDGTIESISLIYVYEHQGSYMPENGNKRAAFLYSQGQEFINAHIREHDEEDIELLEVLVLKAQSYGVNNLEDLTKRIVPRDEYDLIMITIDDLEI